MTFFFYSKKQSIFFFVFVFAVEKFETSTTIVKKHFQRRKKNRVGIRQMVRLTTFGWWLCNKWPSSIVSFFCVCVLAGRLIATASSQFFLQRNGGNGGGDGGGGGQRATTGSYSNCFCFSFSLLSTMCVCVSVCVCCLTEYGGEIVLGTRCKHTLVVSPNVRRCDVVVVANHGHMENGRLNQRNPCQGSTAANKTRQVFGCWPANLCLPVGLV